MEQVSRGQFVRNMRANYGASLAEANKAADRFATFSEAEAHIAKTKAPRVAESAPWVRLAREDLEVSSAAFAAEYADLLYPKLIRCHTVDQQIAAMRQCFVEVVEAAP